MKKLTYEKDGKMHGVIDDFQMLAPAVLWELYLGEKHPKRKEILNDVYHVICALYYGKVKGGK